ncbi:hypothetical protein GA0070558_1327 [Micromonospora haikouensis]|uniref:DUF2268 domain-containing protein n=1 Tax=Micromonospora haikouensis TaxID=686309 RepID=A0A1C4XYX3_9ACTN|nr:hypothetical protein [Micromonospora haikouensis]SCF13673.1 hypothetical protein GA0070558_1327 [Micromonospora haikouensis]
MTGTPPDITAGEPSVRVRDLVPTYLEYARSADGASPARRSELWRSRYLDRHPDVFAAALDRAGEWSGGDDLPAVLDQLTEDRADLSRRAARLRIELPDAVRSVAGALGWADDRDPIECVTLVGLRRANGWADRLDGRYALFLAVEQLGDLAEERLLVHHETAHVVHDRLATIRDWPEHGVAASLLAEGLATEVTTETVPGLSDEAYLWFHRPGYEPWLAECRTRWEEIIDRIIADLDATDLDRNAPYFLMRDLPDGGDLPKRCGYLVGLRLVRELRRHYPLPETARWDLDRAVPELRRALGAVAVAA